MKKLKYLHCVIDDKFIDGAISLFESVLPGSSMYVFVELNFSKKKKTLKRVKSQSVKMVSELEFSHLVSQFDIIILHSLFSLSPKLICSIPRGKKVVWFAWGYDLYRKNILPVDLYYPETKKIVCKSFSLRNFLLSFRSYLRGQNHPINAIRRVDYFSGVFPYEYDLLKEQYPSLLAKPLDFYYGSKDFFVPEKPEKIINNRFRNVIIGNSNAPTNNHIDAFSYMSHLELCDGGKIILPLSYSLDEDYKEVVKECAFNLWGKENVLILDHFLPLKEYVEIVSNCRVAVYFHERQQASDNVFMQLLFGAKVYMSDTSQMFLYLKSLGFYVFSLQKESDGINEPLCDEYIMHNRVLLSKLYSSSKILKRVKIIDEIIASDF